MTDDLKRAATNLRSEGWDDEAAAVDAAADRIEELEKNFELQLEWYLSNKRRLDDRIEELEAALRRISHATHGKVFNEHGHEEAYLIACKALEEKDGLAANANKEMFKWINAQSHWKPDEDLYTVVLMKTDGLPETNLTYSFEHAWEYATKYKEEVMYFLKQVKESE